MSGFKSFKEMKKNRSKLRKSIEAAVTADGKKINNDDERSWYPKRDDKGQASAVIRFLPPASGNTLPYVKLYKHFFKGPGGWFVENCATTLGKDCFVCSKNKELWNSGIESNKDLARQRKRGLEYFYNIFVVDDKTQDDMTGKNKIFKSGAYIFKSIQSALNPEFDDDESVDAFDLWEGADFQFKMYNKEDQLSYDKSKFKNPSEFFKGDEKKQEEIYDAMYDLSEFVKEDLFKTDAELEKKYNKVLGIKSEAASMDATQAQQKSVEASKTVDYTEAEAIDEEDALAAFERMADEG